MRLGLQAAHARVDSTVVVVSILELTTCRPCARGQRHLLQGLHVRKGIKYLSTC